MDYLAVALAVAIAIIVAIASIKSPFQRVTIFEYEKGLKYTKGKYVKTLGAGQYWIFKPDTTIEKVDTRVKFVSLVGQEVLSSDGITLRVSLAAQYEIANPYTALTKTQNYQEALYILLQIAIREAIAGAKIDRLLEQRHELSNSIVELTASKVEQLGLRLLSADIKDMMLPGELKKIYAQVIKARQEGLAALEKARGETAALRNLANAARMLEGNPALLQLRLIQSLESSSGHTVILGAPAPPGAIAPAIGRQQEREANSQDASSG